MTTAAAVLPPSALALLLTLVLSLAQMVMSSCPDARAILNETMKGAEAAFISSNSECLQRCIPPTAPSQQPCDAVCEAGADEYGNTCRKAGGVLITERTRMRWALSLDVITTTRPFCVPSAADCSAAELLLIMQEMSLAFCSTMGFFLLDQCNVFLDILAPPAPAPPPPAAVAAATADVLVYGSTPGAVISAVAAARQGATTILLDPAPRVGGMCSGGLGRTDRGNSIVIGGFAQEFFERNRQHYHPDIPVGGQPGTVCHDDTHGTDIRCGFYLEPHVAEGVFLAMLADAGVQHIVTNGSQVRSAAKKGTMLTSLTLEDGQTYNARIFVDGTYHLRDISTAIGTLS
eukprot:COSAG01_NODE_13999_length_1509_cov_1.356028_1_plen_346_part_00